MRIKYYTKDDLRRAMKHTRSGASAARYLGCSYQHYKKYAKLYKDEETGKTFFELQYNRQGKGITKHLFKKPGTITPLNDILEGRANIADFKVSEIKERIIQEGHLAEECNRCQFNERRVVDYKVPLIINFKDRNKVNWKIENLEMLCYNCYFLHIGDVWSKNQLEQMEDYSLKNKFFQDESPDWNLDKHHIAHLKELGLWEDEDDGSEYISKL